MIATPASRSHAAILITRASARRPPERASPPYDRTRLYRKGRLMVHQTYGEGDVTALIEPRKSDVLFPDRMRRLVHAR